MQRTGGKLSQADRRALMRQAVHLQWSRLEGRIARALGKRQAGITEESFHIPDSALALRAAEVCALISPTWLQHHCTRTYVWGSLLALRREVSYDAELLYVAAMLHDLGLTPPYWGKDATAHCFAVEGARAAKTFALEAHWDEQRQEALAEAISLHLNVEVDVEQGVEAHLLHAGAAYDVIGAAFQSIAPATRLMVVERYPRLSFKHEMEVCLQQQVALRPDSRVAMLYDAFQFGKRITAAPFEE